MVHYSYLKAGAFAALLFAVGCGRPTQIAPFVPHEFASGTAQVTYTKDGLSDSRVYARKAADGLGIHCAGNKDATLIEFVTVHPDSRNGKVGKPHLIIRAAHPDGPASKPTDLAKTTFKLDWPPQKVKGEAGTYERAGGGDQSCKLTFRKEKSRAIGTFDCQKLESNDGPTPSYVRVNGSFDCFVFDRPVGPISSSQY